MTSDRAPALDRLTHDTDLERRLLTWTDTADPLTGLQDKIVDVLAAVDDRDRELVAGRNLNAVRDEAHAFGVNRHLGAFTGRHDGTSTRVHRARRDADGSRVDTDPDSNSQGDSG